MLHVTTKLSKSIGSHRIPSNLGGIDLNVFKDRSSECKPPPNDALLTESCPVLKRLCVASRYFDVLNVSELDDNDKKTVFVGFNEDVYDLVVDDTAHLTQKHSDDLLRIYKEWTQKYGFSSCTVSECAKSTRHYGRGRGERVKAKKQKIPQNDPIYSFYQSIYDRTHNFVAHLYDIGMRVDESTLLQNMGGDGKDGVFVGLSVDKLFEAERDRIRMSREECNLDLDRLHDPTNKYTMQMAEMKKGGMTLLDALCDGMAKLENMKREILQEIIQYLKQNAYDSDAVESDLAEVSDSNIYGVVKDKMLMDWMMSFIRTKNCM